MYPQYPIPRGKTTVFMILQLISAVLLHLHITFPIFFREKYRMRSNDVRYSGATKEEFMSGLTRMYLVNTLLLLLVGCASMPSDFK